MTDWQTAPAAPVAPPGLRAWVRVLAKGAAMAGVTYAGLAVLLLVRLAEAPLFRPARPWTPAITGAVCRLNLWLLGLRRETVGQPMPGVGAVVANHSSWLDIFVLNAGQNVFFVAKSEVFAWAGIGWLARATGTLFITRKGTEARRQQDQLSARLAAGHRLLFFPEGTSTDSVRVLPFKSTLFEAFFTPGLPPELMVQPVTATYHAPPGQDARFYGWWGDMDFAGHLLLMLAAPRHGRVVVTYHPPVPVRAFAGRKDLAAHCERVIRTAHGALAANP